MSELSRDAGLDAVRAVVARAFEDDPLMRWVFPDDDRRLESTAAWLGLFVEAYARSGRLDSVDAGGATAAAALWRIPADTDLALPTLPTLPGLLTALVGPTRAAGLRGGFRVLAGLRPNGPHAYLHFLAVDPPHQRTGLGRRVIAPGLAAAAELGLGTHLETNEEANLGFYRSLGFKVTAERRLAPDGPPVWAMWRESGPLDR